MLYIIIDIKKNRKKLKLFPSERSNYNRKINYFIILRAWIELAEKTYANRLNKIVDNTTIISINPGYLDKLPSRRQNLYIKNLKDDKKNYIFNVPRINVKRLIKEAIKIIFSGISKELKIPMLMMVNERHKVDDYVDYLVNNFPTVKKIYTQEEFDPNTTYLTEKLNDQKIKVINMIHGLGIYNPYIKYDTLYVFSKMQKDYYPNSTKTKLYGLNMSNKELNKVPVKPLALIFIGQTFISRFSTRLIEHQYRTIVNYVENIAKEFDISVFVKYHPNSKEEDKIFSDKIIVVNGIEELPLNYSYISLTLSSTYALDILNSIPFIILNPQEKINLQYIFPNDDLIIIKSYEAFKNRIEKFLKDPNYYKKFSEKFYKLIRDNFT